MATVPVRPPRFLGEKVQEREQTVQERIQSQLGPEYSVESSNGGYTAKAKPVKYLRKKDSRTKVIRRGEQYQYGSYSPHEIKISSEGEVQKETRRGTHKTDATGKIRTWDVYTTEVTDYDKQTRFTYGKRDLKSGRETIKQTSSQVAGRYKEKRIIDQDTKEYEQSRRTEEQARLIREEGFTVRRTERYAVAGMTKQQREQYYKVKAQQRTAQLSMEAKAQRIAREETERFRGTLSKESQIYAMDIVAEQEASRKARGVWVKTTPPPKSPDVMVSGVTPSTPASPTTRTDMGDRPFLIGGKLPPGEVHLIERKPGVAFAEKKAKEGGIPGFFYATYAVSQDYERQQDIMSLKAGRARAGGKPVAGIGYSAQEFALSVPVGAYKLAKNVITQPQEVIGGMFNPESYRQAGVMLRERPAKFTGELTGAVLLSYGVGKGIQTARTELAKPKVAGGESAIPGPKIKKTEFQSRFPKEGKGVDIVTTKQMKFLKQKTGKGQIESTVFSSKKVIDKKGRTVETPSITKVRDEIAGKPSKIGTIYGEKVGKPVKVSKTIETTLTKPEVIARSKWLPGDVRKIVMVRGKPMIADWTGGTLRPYRPGEFTLETVYSGGGLTATQRATIGHQTLRYSTTVQTKYGPFSITKKPGAGTQSTLYPKEIVIVRKPGATLKGPTIQTLDKSIKTAKPPSETVVDSGPGSQLVTKTKPQKFATAGEVLPGTLKVYPKYQVTQSRVVPRTKIPETGDPTVITEPVSSGALAGLFQFPQPIAQQPSTISTPVVEVVPRVDAGVSPDIDVGSASISKAEAKAKGIAIVEPISVPDTVTRTKTETELVTETVLETDLLTEQIVRPAPRTTPSGPLDVTPVEPPPPVFVLKAPKEEVKKKRGLYQVEVREKGIFKKVKVTPSVEEAFRFGEKRVKATASASLRVKPVAGGKSVSGIGRALLSKKIFRESKKEPGVFIQRKQFRISSPGEKREITHKGLRALKIRGIFRR